MCGRSITIFVEACGALNQGFPFSPLQCRQGRARMGGVCGGMGGHVIIYRAQKAIQGDD
jgi:hypothetical protein